VDFLVSDYATNQGLVPNATTVYCLPGSRNVSLRTDAGSAKKLATVGPSEKQVKLSCPHGEFKLTTGGVGGSSKIHRGARIYNVVLQGNYDE
jgi:hypothetical protein